MRHEASGIAENAWYGAWRASVPAIAVFAFIRSLLCQPRPRLARLGGRRFKPPASFMSCLLGMVLFAQSCALPMCFGLLLVGSNARPMTKGCKKGTCCTALCYLDKYGIHHCVHGPGDSCECGMAAGDSDTNSPLPAIAVALPKPEPRIPSLIPTGYVFQAASPIESRDQAVPSPPPK